MRIPGCWLCLVSLASVGCADLLGLKSLTYDGGGEQEDAPALVPSEPTGDGDVPASGGGPMEDEDFPASFAGSSVWGASPLEGEPYYWVYDPTTETLSSFILRMGSKDLLGHQSWPFAGTLKLLAVVPTALSTTLIGYDPEGAEVSYVTGADGLGTLEQIHSGTGTSGRTAMLPVFTGEEWVSLTYSESNGTYRYFRPKQPTEEQAVFSGQWEAGWTSLVRFSTGGQHGVIKHNRNTRRLAFDRFGAYGSPLAQITSFELDFDASIVTVFSRQNEHFLLFYQDGTGEAATARFTLREPSSTQGGAAGSEEFEFEILKEGVLRGDLTQIVTLSHQEGPFAITFSSSSGKATLAQLWPLEPGSPIVVR